MRKTCEWIARKGNKVLDGTKKQERDMKGIHMNQRHLSYCGGKRYNKRCSLMYEVKRGVDG
jgi:hypothetical protein